MRKLSITIIILLGITLNSFAQWSTISVPSSGNIESIKFFSPTKGYASSNISFLTTADGGLTWNNSKLSGFRDIDFTDSLNGYADGIIGLIQKTTNGGNTWTTLTAPKSNSLWGVSMINSNIIYFSVTGGLVYKTTNGGLSFTILTVEPNGNTLTDIYFNDQNNGFVCVSNGSIYKTSNGGTSWSKVYSTTNIVGLNSIYNVNSTIGFVVGTSGTILKTIDGGNNWISLNSSTLKSLNYVHFYDANNGIIVGDSGTVLTTTNGGSSWFYENVGGGVNLNAAYLLSPTSAVIGGLNNIYKNTNHHVNTTEIIPNKNDFNIYPNPAKNFIAIEIINQLILKKYKVTIFDVLGRLIAINELNNGHSFIDISNLPADLYKMVISDENNYVQTYTFIKD